ncbi:MAG TPA: caspase family protein, partial [Dongiaceae bacterium]
MESLDRVAGDVDEVTRFFTQAAQGYERALTAELPLGATARQIEDGLDRWFGSEDRREDDCVVVYVAGHGDSGVKFKDHVLFTRDSSPRLASSVIRTADLMRWLFGGEGARPQSILLILDVCYAGQGAGEALAELVKGGAQVLRGGAGFWVVATSDPNSEAGDGTFVSAFLAIMKDEAWAPRGGAEFISPADLSVAVNQRFRDQPSAQQALLYTVAAGRIAPPFIRNPGFTRDLDGLSIADQAHWDPKARGV